MDKKLTFKVEREGHKELVDPVWRECEVENTECPLCHHQMTVILGHRGILYAHCIKCDKYFTGE